MSINFEKNLPQYIQNLITSYENFEFKNQNKVLLPDKEQIITLIEDIRTLLFPKYFFKEETTKHTIKYLVGELFVKIHKILSTQITLAFLSKNEENNENLKERVEEICHKFFERLPFINELLANDITATFSNDPAAENKSQIIFSYPGIYAISIYRIAHELFLLNVPIIPRIMTEYAHSQTGIDIHPGAEIGNNFFIDHGTGIVIGETTIIGNNVRMYQGVTLGALSIKNRENCINKKRHPTIQDNVTLYAGVTVLGGDTVIGENSIIGGSAFITKSIPKNSIVTIEMPKLKVNDLK